LKKINWQDQSGRAVRNLALVTPSFVGRFLMVAYSTEDLGGCRETHAWRLWNRWLVPFPLLRAITSQ
jgi:hypothetical protein